MRKLTCIGLAVAVISLCEEVFIYYCSSFSGSCYGGGGSGSGREDVVVVVVVVVLAILRRALIAISEMMRSVMTDFCTLKSILRQVALEGKGRRSTSWKRQEISPYWRPLRRCTLRRRG